MTEKQKEGGYMDITDISFMLGFSALMLTILNISSRFR